MNKGMTKSQMICAMFNGENGLYQYQVRDIMKLTKERIEYAYNVYKLLCVQMYTECNHHIELIKKYLLGCIY